MDHAAHAYDMVIMIHVVPSWSTLRPSLPGKAEWFATMERAGVPMFNDVEEMAETAGLLARYPALRDSARGDSFSSVTIRTRHHP